MVNKLKCPKCGGDKVVLQVCYDMGDTILEDGSPALVEDWGCRCRDCGASINALKTYKFVGFDGVTVIPPISSGSQK